MMKSHDNNNKAESHSSILTRTFAAWTSGAIAISTLLSIWISVSETLQWSLPLYIGIALITFIGVYIATHITSLKNTQDFLNHEILVLQNRLQASETALERERDRGLEHGLIRAGGSTYLILQTDIRKGSILYKDRRNILLNCTTVHLIMADIIRHSGEPSLRSLGEEIGKYFATKTFSRFLLKKAESETIREQDKIHLWVEYDREAGFGNLRDNTHYEDETRRYEGSILLDDSFLTDGRIAESENLCVFMEGYIEGVLNVIAGNGENKIIVTHTTCGCNNILPEIGCSFKLSYS